MKRSTTISMLILLLAILMALPAPMAAQDPGDVQNPRAPRPSQTGAPVPEGYSPEWGGTWQNGPATTFTWNRFDSGYYPGDGLVYFMGGREASGITPDTDGSVWSFDPATGTYTDMGVDLVTPISNYTMHLLQDATGTGFYVFCGRPTGGGVTDAVQVYYPDTNTTVQLPVADDYPGTGTCTSAVNISYDNKVYVAGGFDPTVTPSNWGETWVFDPQAASGSRWTQIASANLSTPRAYIMGAEVDGKLYAIGGNWYDSTSTTCGEALCNVATVEVMDPADATPTWNDAAAADLPEPCSETRAWGFDSDSPYTDPDGTFFAGKIVSACGFWPDENERVYIYDTAVDYWEAFPSLLTDRRDTAGSFVPPAALQANGQPGLWVFGGRKDTDTNVLNSTEYYDVGTNEVECNVLLVDDDWDFTSTLGGGRPYYTSTLDFAGYDYDIWDTVSQGVPSSNDMAPYRAVVWFTGYDWRDPISPTTEGPELQVYLANGGNLFLSSQEQNYAYGNTPLFQNYLGVASMVDDVVLTHTVGISGNVIGDGLGPYTLVRPDDWEVYWPTAQYEGPYTDEAYANASADEAFRYDEPTNTNPNAITNDAGDYRTLYMAYPFEWTDTLTERVQILDTALTWLCEPRGGEVALQPAMQDSFVDPGNTANYAVYLTNRSGQAEFFDITYGGNVWPTTVTPMTVGPVSNGATVSFTVQVDVPPGASVPFTDTLTVTGTAQSNANWYDTALIRTHTVAAVEGHIYDANTSTPLEGYVYIYDANDPNVEFEAFTDANGYYSLKEQAFGMRDYDMYGAVIGYDRVDVTLSFTGLQTTTVDFYLPAPILALTPPALTVDVGQGTSTTVQLNLANNGSTDLFYRVDEIGPDVPFTPAGQALAAPYGVDRQVYADLDASPDGTAEVLVVMEEQADLSAAYDIDDWSARGQYVYDTLKATAERSQANVRKYLDNQGATYHSFISVNALGLTADKAAVNALAALPEVKAIVPGYTFEIPEPIADEGVDMPEALPWNVTNIEADQVWSQFGVTGQGIVVANIDTGVQYDHPALVAQYRGNDGGGTFDHNYNWWDPRNACELEGYPADTPCDNDSHGTHTMGSMVGSDDPTSPLSATNAIGVAPGAEWIACKGCEYVEGWPCSSFALLECADFMIAPWDLSGANPDPDMRPHIVNNSWGGGPNDGWYFNDALSAWRAAGIFPAFSAGNAGSGCNTVNSPSDYYNAFASGAVDSNDVIAGFSSRGPSDLGLQKPQVSAPGVSVRSSVPNDAYAYFGGTSMASPHSAGEVALIWSAQPELIGQVQVTEWLVERTAEPILDNQCGPEGPPNYVYGWGRINAYNAVDTALNYTWDVAWLDVAPDMGSVAMNDNLDLDITFDASGLTLDECYTATLKVETNDPYQGLDVFVPVEMCVVEPMNYFYLPLIYKGY